MKAHDNYNWGILDIEGVEDVVHQAAAKVARRYPMPEDDLIQEARARVCDLNTNLPECAFGVGTLTLGTLQYRLEQDLVDIAKREQRHQDRNTSYEQRYEGTESHGPKPPSIVIRQEVGAYDRELVKALLPAVWDEFYCYGMKVENAPDGDMPRGSTNKATGNTLAAHIADIKVGWEKAPLSLNERRALLLGHGLDCTQAEASRMLGVDQSAISRWLYTGVGKVVATLNGDDALLAQVSEAEEVAA